MGRGHCYRIRGSRANESFDEEGELSRAQRRGHVAVEAGRIGTPQWDDRPLVPLRPLRRDARLRRELHIPMVCVHPSDPSQVCNSTTILTHIFNMQRVATLTTMTFRTRRTLSHRWTPAPSLTAGKYALHSTHPGLRTGAGAFGQSV